ncbi:MFS transporter [Streptomyces sp. NPDC087849]|uniref:MFS transporter n=1 Tax=Streptomyces sp. NPDC087849 TaxID=3365808 RepID=UPI0037FC3E27
MKGDVSLLRERNFLLFFLARTSSLTGNVIAPLGLAFAVLALPDGSPSQLGLLLGTRTVAQLGLILLGGVLADRFPRQRLIIVGETAAGCSQALTAALFLHGSVPMNLLFVLAAVNGASSAVSQPAATALVPQLVDAERIQPANALLRLAANFSRIGGVFAGGLLVAAVAPGWALAADAASYFLSAVLLMFSRPRTASRALTATEAPTSLLRELHSGWTEFASLRWMWPVVGQFAIVNAAFGGAIMVLGPAVAEQKLGGAVAWSVVLGAHSAGFVLGSLIAIRIRPRYPLRTGVFVTFGFFPAYLFLAAGSPTWLIATSMLVAGICIDVFEVLWRTTVHTHVPEQAMSRISSYDSLVSFVCTPLGLAVAGPVAAHIGIAEALLLSGVLVFLASTVPLLFSAVRNLPARCTVPEHVPG